MTISLRGSPRRHINPSAFQNQDLEVVVVVEEEDDDEEMKYRVAQ